MDAYVHDDCNYHARQQIEQIEQESLGYQGLYQPSCHSVTQALTNAPAFIGSIAPYT